MTYEYKSINRLRSGERFMFIGGKCINQVVVLDRNRIVFTNLITKKSRPMRVETGDKNQSPLRWVKSLDGFFERDYQARRDTENCPF